VWLSATRRETQIPFGNDNKNKDSASEEKAVRLYLEGNLAGGMRKPQQGGWGVFLIVISIVDDWVKLIRQMTKQNISFVMCRLDGFQRLGGLDKKTWLAEQPI
jgi:hypothetical protein